MKSQSRLALWEENATTDWTLDQFEIGRAKKDTADEFVSQYHYSGGMGNAPIPFKIYHSTTGALVGIIAFHTPISENTRASVFEDITEGAHKQGERCTDCVHIADEHCYREHVTELHRMAIHPDAPPNTASWAISRALDALKTYKPKYWAVLSFADTTEGHDGTVYQAANADYTGMTDESTFYRDSEGTLRAPRQCGTHITLDEADRRGWEPVKRKSKHRYVFWTPDEYQTKDDLRELSNFTFMEYP